jgi:hypothetical protein
MKKATLSIVPVILLSILFILSPARSDAQARNRFTVRVTPGPDYAATTSILFFIKVPLHPQIACWLETQDGKYVGTLYVTAKGAKKNFFSAPAGRPEALPVRYHLQGSQGPAADAVSGATSGGRAEHVAQLPTPLAPGRYVAFLEVNRSYDYNERFTKKNSGVNGQPSIIYRAEIEVGKDGSKAVFSPVGMGSDDGADGRIQPGLDGITTAIKLIDTAEIEYSGS